MSQIRYFLDITPFRDYAWTGIPTVTAEIARHLLERMPESSFFYYGPDIIRPEFVRIAIEKSPGGYLRSLIEAGTATSGSLADMLARSGLTVGLFPNIKPIHRMFNVELNIIHDLSAVLLPEVHTPRAAVEHSQAYMRDIGTSDLVCCVSEATRQDVLLYLKADLKRVFVSHLGCRIDTSTEAMRERSMRGTTPPYIVVLGTVEPRKNLRLIADLIRHRPRVCEEFAFFFVGRRGWGAQFEEIFGDIMRMPQCRDRLLFTDYVDDEVKKRLLRRAAFAIYPSLFEGFGLPVIECMAEGCPVIASRTSSLVELGLDDSCYFDPWSLNDFARCFDMMHSVVAQPTQREHLSHDVLNRASKFTWGAFMDRVLARIDEVVAAKRMIDAPPTTRDLPQRRRTKR